MTEQDQRSGIQLPVALAFAGLCLLWGSTYLFIKIGLDYWPPILYSAVRNLVAWLAVALVLVASAVIWRRPRRLPGLRGWGPPAGFALLQGTAFALIFWAEKYISSGQTAVLIATNPLFTLPLARLWFKQRPTPTQYLAVALGLVGVALTAGVREGAGFEGSERLRTIAQAAVLLAAFCYAVSLLFSRRYMSGDRYVNTAIHLGTSGLYLLLLSSIMDPPDAHVELALPGVLALLYLALPGSALAYWLLFYLNEKLNPLQVSYVSVVNPVVAVLLGVVVLSEPLTVPVVLGVVAVMVGIYLVNRPARAAG